MQKGRFEAFTDGVIAIIITLMVLDLKPPHDPTWRSLAQDWPHFAAYLLSFMYLGIYWNNHHHMMTTVKKVSGGVLWANLSLLFWLSLTPLATAWMGETGFAPTPVAAYGFMVLAAAGTWMILCRALIAANGKDSPVAIVLGKDFKGKVSFVIYFFAVAISHWVPMVSCCLYAGVSAVWLVPDRRFERWQGHASAEEVGDEG